ncbi:Methylated-DNA--protein-cysteine methyltransferase, constitutive [Oxalobacter formigenes]|uniref:6-O-methylguanine DNA methyltransferase, DNA binding domain protein n=1 Tax=Oxalobacter formigenes OXCC13 TaxID=556269 RepID=C3X9W7_OXAFO|nr:Methylated-DNA--protein-cysteine methyltransferase, constitutive [Oxalobacter formigenes]EEO29993.1 6-O-methylguanine DNA methyltransferase, DNA binding domain protein [Oxalobacter formigenes OXCC13]
MHYIHQYASPLGNITMASNGESLTGLWFNGQKYFADTLPAENREKELPIFEQTASWLDAYFRGDIPDFTPALHMDGSPFRQMVWEILLQIPHGKVVTYGDIARMIASKTGLKKPCLHKPLVVPSATIPFPSSSPATESSARREA